MANRLDATFARLRQDARKGFIAYLTAGDPDLPRSLEAARALARAGADVIELGVPFSDPLADGPTNQAAAQRALEAGTTVVKLLAAIREFRRDCDVPLVLFTYLNPVFTYGFERFHADAAAAGVDGILILDLPPEEEALSESFSHRHGLRSIRLIAPTTPPERMERIARRAEGFIYYVSREGVTGEQTQLADTIAGQVAEIRRHTDLPIAVGFGISTPEQAAEAARSADAVVVGSAIVRRVGEFGRTASLAAKIESFTRPLVEAVKSV
ncbi:MAG TPA: tryptophan synthase subunit alpha [Chthoniobacterales bacterium]